MLTSDHNALESRNHVLIIVFDVLVLLGFLLFLLTLLPAALSKAVQRGIVWYSLMMAWLVYSATYGLLVGRQEGPDPPLPICLAQTTLLYAAPVVTSTATLCYYIEFFLLIYSFRSARPRQPSSTRVVWLAITPWIAFLATVVEVLLFVFLGDRLPQVQRMHMGFYCHLVDRTPNLIAASVVVTCMIILLSLESYTGYFMLTNWGVFKLLSKNDRQIFITVYLRLILCTIAAVLAIVLSTLALKSKSRNDLPTFVYPAVPIIIALAFGTQKDLLRTWLFWRSPKPYGSIIFNNGTRNDGILASTVVVCSSSNDMVTTIDHGSSGSSQQNQSEKC